MAQDTTSSTGRKGGKPSGTDNGDPKDHDRTPSSTPGGSRVRPDRQTNKEWGKKNQKIEELREEYGPDEKFPIDPEDAGPKRSQKQPGQGVRESKEDTERGE